ncbi:MAG: hypothetical protein K5685_03970 [Bacteroidales bacterium]|nr:hypothetical protein [Bacteroidales bacterium]
MEKLYYKAMTRQELAQKAGVCIATFNKWLNRDSPVLKKLGYLPRGLLNPAVVKFICEKYCIEI